MSKKIEIPNAVFHDLYMAASAIAPDMMDIPGGCDNEALVEAILDGDYVSMFGNSDSKAESSRILKEMFKEFGFDKVVKAAIKSGRCNFI